MSDIETPPTHDGAPEAPAKSRPRAEAHPGAQTGPAADRVKGEPRSFAEAGEAVRHAADQAKDLAATSQEAMRKVGGQAVELWRASLDPLTNMQSELGRWVEQAWRQGLSARVPGAPLFGESLFAVLAGAPTTDLYETQAGLELVIELPGLSAQQVQLSLTGDILTVSGERTETAERNEGAYRVRERRSGGFRRAFALPADIDPKGIQAQFDKGILTVSIPRSGEGHAESRTIPIKG